MKIQFETYNPIWAEQFQVIKRGLKSALVYLAPGIEHIGSTSVKGLSAKPIIDILVGLERECDLDKVVPPLSALGYTYYPVYNGDMPYRRFFVKHKTGSIDPGSNRVIVRQDDVPRNTEEHSSRLAHIHVLPYGGKHWQRHIAFRDYLRCHPAVKAQYQHIKEELSVQDWVDGNAYNKAKDDFLKTEEQKAVEWYLAR